MSQRPVEPEDYGDVAAGDSHTDTDTGAGPPPSANQMKAEPESADAEPEDSEAESTSLMAAAPSAADGPVRVAHVVPGHPDGEVDTTR